MHQFIGTPLHVTADKTVITTTQCTMIFGEYVSIQSNAITFKFLSYLTLWGPRNEIKGKTLHFIRKTDLNTIQIIIFITKYKKNYNLLQNLGGFKLKPLGLQSFFF